MGNLKAARLALEGLSVGDGLGDQFFSARGMEQLVQRVLPDGVWPYTDDTNMALSVYESLRLHGTIQPDALAMSFGEHYDNQRKYGSSMHNLLRAYAEGSSWSLAQSLFEGQGSYGNGAAMRIAPLGAYFAERKGVDAALRTAPGRVERSGATGLGVAAPLALLGASLLARRPVHSQTELAGDGLSPSYISLLESGRRRPSPASCTEPWSPARGGVPPEAVSDVRRGERGGPSGHASARGVGDRAVAWLHWSHA